MEALNRLARSKLYTAASWATRRVVTGGRASALGDAVIAGPQPRPVWAGNGTRRVVTAVHTSRRQLTIKTSEGRTIDVHLANGPLAHG